jgi:hypothetical protein
MITNLAIKEEKSQMKIRTIQNLSKKNLKPLKTSLRRA